MIRTRWVVATLLAACLLAGCSDDDPEPKIDADATPSETSAGRSTATVSTSPTVTPTVALGPEETVRAWVEARNAALNDGDTADVDRLSASDCRSCEELNKVIRQVYEAGGNFHTDGWQIDSLKQKPGAQPVQVDTALTFAVGETVPSTGADPVSYAEEKHIVSFRLVQSEGQFKVQLVLFLS